MQAILQYNGKDHVTKKVGDRYVSTEVQVGLSNEKFVQVVKGLSDGDLVVLNPISLMTEDEKREAFRSASKESKKEWGPGGPPEEDAAKGKVGVPGKDGARPKARVAIRPRPRARAPGARVRDVVAPWEPIFQKLQKLSDEERSQLRSPDTSAEEKAELYKKAGVTDAEIQQMQEMRKNFGGGRGGRWRRWVWRWRWSRSLRRRRRGRIRSVNQHEDSARSSSKPIVKLVDVVKTYVMGHPGGGGGLLRRRRYQQSGDRNRPRPSRRLR